MGRRRERVFEQAVGELRTMIENGEVQPGDRLPPEPELSDQFNIGRSSVREAMRILESEGLVEIRRGTGTFVTSREAWLSSRNSVIRLIKEHEAALIHLLEAREGLEGMAVHMAAQNPPAELLSELRAISNEMDELISLGSDDIDFAAVASLNSRFHLSISRASGNPLLHQLILHLLGTFAESNEAILYTGLSVDIQVKEHGQIAKAIEDRDPIKAENLMRAHIARVRREIREMTVD
jgi:DNA-binding FadR family transcriptional regulator